MPTPTARPDREIILRVTPEKYISTMAKMTLTGMETAIIKVGLMSFKKKRRIIIANTAPKARFSSTELIIIWI